jgi:hypothetical protein
MRTVACGLALSPRTEKKPLVAAAGVMCGLAALSAFPLHAQQDIQTIETFDSVRVIACRDAGSADPLVTAAKAALNETKPTVLKALLAEASRELLTGSAGAAERAQLHLVRIKAIEADPCSKLAGPPLDTLHPSADFQSTPAVRFVTGVDISGASSGEIDRMYFVAAMLQAPVGRLMSGNSDTDPLASRYWLFLSPRILSFPQPPSEQLTNSLAINSLGDSVQAVDISGGLEVALLKPRNGIPFWATLRNSHARLGVSAFVSGGFVSQFSAATAARPYDLNDAARPRFLRKYYGGLRFKTYLFSSLASDVVHNQFPGIVDLGVGRDESVTAGRLSSWIFRFDSVYPFPFARSLTIFASLHSALTKSELPVPELPLRNRDYFRIGIGIDLLELLKRGERRVQVRQTPLRYTGSFDGNQ